MVFSRHDDNDDASNTDPDVVSNDDKWDGEANGKSYNWRYYKIWKINKRVAPH